VGRFARPGREEKLRDEVWRALKAYEGEDHSASPLLLWESDFHEITDTPGRTIWTRFKSLRVLLPWRYRENETKQVITEEMVRRDEEKTASYEKPKKRQVFWAEWYEAMHRGKKIWKIRRGYKARKRPGQRTNYKKQLLVSRLLGAFRTQTDHEIKYGSGGGKNRKEELTPCASYLEVVFRFGGLQWNARRAIRAHLNAYDQTHE